MKKPVVKQRLLYRIMKITLFQMVLAFVFSTVMTANSVKGQKKLDTKVTISITNMSLSNALAKLEKSADVKFSYNSRISQLNQKVSINASEETLYNVLFEVFKPLNIDFAEVSDQIVLQSKTENETAIYSIKNLFNNAAYAGIVVNGKITDENGNPLPGATVMAKGTKVAVLTDFDGNFTIEMPENASKIVISYIGMKTKEIDATSKFITVVLSKLGENLNEVVITTGYEKTSKRTFTGAISKINSTELKVDGVVDVSLSLIHI